MRVCCVPAKANIEQIINSVGWVISKPLCERSIRKIKGPFVLDLVELTLNRFINIVHAKANIE